MSTYKPRGYSVNDFISWSQRKELILQPKFQRRDVWSPKAKAHLLDTILKGLPIPLIFIRQQIDPSKRKTIREVVDGQQRLRTVLDFCDPQDPSKAIKLDRAIHHQYGNKTFSELPGDVQKDFLSYEFSVVVLEGASDQDVLNIFARLNTYAQKLTAQELLNAAYFGQFKQAMYKLGLDHLGFWRDMGILKDSQIMRMAEAELVSELVVAMMDGIQPKKINIEKFYKKHDESFPLKNKIEKEFRYIVDIISKIYGEDLRSTIYSRRILFYSLFLALYDLIYGFPKSNLKKSKIKITSSTIQNFRSVLDKINIDYKKKKPYLTKFIAATKKATADKRERSIRHNFICEKLSAVS